MKIFVFVSILFLSSVMVTAAMAANSPALADTTAPKQANRRPIQVILPGYQLDTSFSSLTPPDPAIYRVIPKWLRARAAGKPLYVLDGQVAKASQLKGLKAITVESVEVIDGKRAAVLYGSIGRQGVVAITTKAALQPRRTN